MTPSGGPAMTPSGGPAMTPSGGPARRVLVLPPHRDAVLRVLTGLPDVEVVLAPRVDSADPRASLLETASAEIVNHGCTHVVATAERNMALAGQLRDRHLLPGLDGMQSLAVTDKRCTRLWAGPVVPMAAAWPASQVLADPAVLDGVDEVVVKPAVGAACHWVHRMPTGRLAGHLRGLPQVSGGWRVEAALDVRAEFHCDGYFLGHAPVASVVSTYDAPLLSVRTRTRASLHLPDDHPAVGRVRALTTRLIAASPAPDGVFHAEFLDTDDGLYFGEVAYRPGAGGIADSVRRHRGLDVWDTFVRLQIGLSPLPYRPRHPEPTTSWSGRIGVVSRDPSDLDVRRQRLVALPGVVDVEQFEASGSSYSGASSPPTWLVYFRAGSEDESRRLIERVAAAARGPRE